MIRDMRNTARLSIVLERLAIVLVVACMGGAAAILMMAPLVNGLFLLLRDIFGILFLPFSFLFGMAGQTDHAHIMGNVVGGMGTDLLSHPVRTLAAAAASAFSAVLFVVALGPAGRGVMAASLATGLVAFWLGGLTTGMILLPGLMIEILYLLRPARPRDAMPGQ
ncbi:hypothetical protein GLI01_21600 [Gluconacetobacter liquefaciens]|nr:hypothetical protein AA0522_1011 [Gluconacetobacter liquefaciens NRIC 0522]GEB38125.1 hypothetical protein GLI01_21600 [Gluconacetobacter liquefaciens]